MKKSDKMIDELAQLGPEEMRRVIASARRKKLDALWQEQTKKIAVPCMHQDIAWFFSHQRLVLLDRVQEMEFDTNAIPFLPVVPFVWRACADQLCDFVEGRHFASVDMTFAHNIHDRITTFDEPYYVCDVRLGEPIGGAGVKQSVADLAAVGRRPLTLAETISLALQRPEWLDREGLVSGSSGSQEGRLDRKSSYDLVLARTRLHPIELFGWGDGSGPATARLPSCAGAFDPKELFCDATEE